MSESSERVYEELTPRTMDAVLQFLEGASFDCEREAYECEAVGEITPEHMQRSIMLPYEIALTERSKKVVLTTGKNRSIPTTANFIVRRDTSRLSLHTHHIGLGQETTTPSFSDIYLTDFASPRTPLILAHRLGLTVYRRPILLDPSTLKPVRSDIRDTLLLWGEENNIDIFSFGGKNLRSPHDLTPNEKFSLERKFAAEANLIVEDGEWEDTQRIQGIMDYINLRRNKNS
ncbi:MAG: hypothetical protein AAB373_05395 [Patescibacteria group bacterium]